MNLLDNNGATSWPEAIVLVTLLLVVGFLVVLVVGSMFDLRKAKLAASQADDLRQLVHRYEQLAENTMDAQQRAAADLAELRSRTASIEQILRTVE
jgi:Tfp pilus assembly protein PilO